jgi:hypothetical protein
MTRTHFGNPAIVLIAALFLLPGACSRPSSPAAGEATPTAFLNARLRGAIDADLSWNEPELQTEGGIRPDGRGIRVVLAGTMGAEERRIRLVFGIAAAPGESSSKAVPTNLTLIVEGGNRVYATLGDGKCSVDALAQQPDTTPDSKDTGSTGGHYWVSARGFCTEPAATLDGSERVLLSRFDFRSRIHFEALDGHSLAARN